MRICCISDTHKLHYAMRHDVPECDILLHAGDWNYLDSEDEWKYCYFNSEDINALEMLAVF